MRYCNKGITREVLLATINFKQRKTSKTIKIILKEKDDPQKSYMGTIAYEKTV